MANKKPPGRRKAPDGETARPRWSTRRRCLVSGFVTTAADRLRLADWTITVDFDTPAPEGTYASITPHPAQRHATLRLGAPFLGMDAWGQRQALVHELLHCHLFDLELTHGRVVEQLPEPAGELASTVLRDRVEWATDALADAFVVLTADLRVPASPPKGAIRPADVTALEPRRRRTTGPVAVPDSPT